MGHTIFQLFVVSAVTMGISYTVTRERIFAPLRERLGGKETWLGYLVNCPYCASHYIAFVLVPLTGSHFVPISPRWGFVSDVLGWFLSSILVTVVAAFLRVIFYFVDETQGLLRREQRWVDVETEVCEIDRSAAQERANGCVASRRAQAEERQPERRLGRAASPLRPDIAIPRALSKGRSGSGRG